MTYFTLNAGLGRISYSIFLDSFPKNSEGWLVVEKEIKLYKKIQLHKVDPKVVPSEAIFIFLPINEKHIQIRDPGKMIGEVFKKELQKKGITEILVHEKDYFKLFSKSEQSKEEKIKYYSSQIQKPIRESDRSFVIEIIQDKDIDLQHKKSFLTTISVNLLTVFLGLESSSKKEQEQALETSKLIVSDILESVKLNQKSYEMGYKFMLAGSSSKDHSVVVATLSVMFAFLLGLVDENELADICMAGLLHDIGLLEAPERVIRKNINERSLVESEQYFRYAMKSIEKLEQVERKSGMNFTIRMKNIIKETHYLSHTQKSITFRPQFFYSKIVASANIADNIMKGRYDGFTRTPLRTLKILAGLSKELEIPKIEASMISVFKNICEEAEKKINFKIA